MNLSVISVYTCIEKIFILTEVAHSMLKVKQIVSTAGPGLAIQSITAWNAYVPLSWDSHFSLVIPFVSSKFLQEPLVQVRQWHIFCWLNSLREHVSQPMI